MTTRIVPPDTLEGGLVYILYGQYGYSVPVILRPASDPGGSSTRKFRLIGECFIYGTMDGKAIDGQQNRLYVDRIFEIV